MINHPNRKKAEGKSTESSAPDKERAVLVTTQHRGVFFGYATDVQGNIINLRAARNCLYWSADVKGFAGLAATGPSKTCRVGPAVDLQLRDITSVALVTDAAVLAWEAAPWK
ncbi:hypothetical protein LPW26_03415 [Rhodopseudomonas sp. HC1]|uniref:DUF6948 domain-containing protein n=1 Tax=Rhodopseudomonas infernalis TaxID=2897386 RepID=UPI001EE9491A|nr:hypothetical protein [Rhodopseudomonas infernalis]MCG6203675.1 hypothetical protein [Rhodopseudomonas infernalis]